MIEIFKAFVAKFLCRINIHPWCGIFCEEGYPQRYCRFCSKPIKSQKKVENG